MLVSNELVLKRLQLLNMVTTGIVLVTQSGELLWYNTTFQKWFLENKPETFSNLYEILGRKDFRARQGQVVNPFQNPIARNANAGENGNSDPSIGEIRVSDGRYFEISVSPYWDPPLSDEIHEDVYFVNLRDMTEIYNQGDSFHRMFKSCEGLMIVSLKSLKRMTPEERLQFLSGGIVEACQKLLKCEVMETRIYHPETQSLELFAHYGITDEAVKREVCIHPDKSGTIGHVAHTQKTYLCNDTSTDPLYLVGGKDMKSSLTAPILFLGRLLGIVNIESSHTYAFSDLDVRRIELFVQYVAIALNTLMLLDMNDANNENNTRISAERLHSQIAKPSQVIVDAALTLSKRLPSEDVQANLSMGEILAQISQLRGIVKRVGENLQTPPVGQNVTVVSELNEKNILLVSSEGPLIQSAFQMFNDYAANLCIIPSGKAALSAAKAALELGKPYYVIIVDTKYIAGYPERTKFLLELGKVYGNVHPPLLMVQWMLEYDGDHVITNVRSIFPASRSAGYDPSKHELVESMFLNLAPLVAKESATAQTYLEAEIGQRLQEQYGIQK